MACKSLNCVLAGPGALRPLSQICGSWSLKSAEPNLLAKLTSPIARLTRQ